MELQMTISSVVLFVDDLDRSIDFYATFGLDVTLRTPEAALLTNSLGMQVYLRALERASHPLGGVGVQRVVWTAPDREALGQFEETLKELNAYTDTYTFDEIVVVEGRDPSDLPFIATYPGPERVPRQEIVGKIYAS